MSIPVRLGTSTKWYLQDHVLPGDVIPEFEFYPPDVGRIYFYNCDGAQLERDGKVLAAASAKDLAGGRSRPIIVRDMGETFAVEIRED